MHSCADRRGGPRLLGSPRHLVLCIFVVALLASFPLLVPPPPFPSVYHAGWLRTVRLTAASIPHSGTRQRQPTASPPSEATCSRPLCGQSSLSNGPAGSEHGRGVRLRVIRKRADALHYSTSLAAATAGTSENDTREAAGPLVRRECFFAVACVTAYLVRT